MSNIILSDSREKKRFDLEFYGFNIEIAALKTGDYQLKGKENLLSIDRKASISELVSNLFDDYVRFKKELIRASEIDNFYLICEFGLEHVILFPKTSGIPRRKWPYIRSSPESIMKKLNTIYETYGVKTIFNNNRELAEQKTVELLNIAINNGDFSCIEFFQYKPKDKDVS